MHNLVMQSERDVPSLSAISSSRVSSPSSPITVSVHGASDWPSLAPIWADLARTSPHSSFYLSAEWIAAWLEVFVGSIPFQLLKFDEQGRTVAVCLLTCMLESRGPFRLLRIYLNSGGEPVAERTLMEFNNILCVSGKEEMVAEALGHYLSNMTWDEFAIGGICPGAVLNALQCKAFPGLPATMNLRASSFVDLDALRNSAVSYLESLSPNARAQVRRSLRHYADRGAIETEIAPDLVTAERYFEEMCHLHQAVWISRGEPGAFAPGRRLDFHRTLIRAAYAKGSIHLLRVTAGGQTLGILYNFQQNGKIYFFQSGINYGSDRRLKPGLVTHACAIQHYMDLGFSQYDFLAGDAQYKRSLAKTSAPLAWVVFSRPSFKTSFIQSLRRLKQRLKRNAKPRFSTWS